MSGVCQYCNKKMVGFKVFDWADRKYHRTCYKQHIFDTVTHPAFLEDIKRSQQQERMTSG